MTKKLLFGRDVQGYNSFAPSFSDDDYSVTLDETGGTDTVTVPSNFQNWIVSFSYQPGAVIWVSLNKSASPPSGNTFSSTNSELLPGSRTVKAGDIISFYNNGTGIADVGVSLYAIS